MFRKSLLERLGSEETGVRRDSHPSLSTIVWTK